MLRMKILGNNAFDNIFIVNPYDDMIYKGN